MNDKPLQSCPISKNGKLRLKVALSGECFQTSDRHEHKETLELLFSTKEFYRVCINCSKRQFAIATPEKELKGGRTTFTMYYPHNGLR